MTDLPGSQQAAPLIEVSQLCQQKQGQELLKRIDLNLYPAEVLVMIGPSGGGKSTLLRLLNRLDEASSGQILLRGQDIRELKPSQLRRRVAMVLQKPVMFSGTLLQNLQHSYALRRETPPAEDSAQLREVLELCGLDPELLAREAGQLSVGQQQRVSLARVLLNRPEVLLLDEPTSALDRPSVDRLGEVLRRLCREWQLAILMISHDLRLAERVADRVAFLQAGEIREQGTFNILRQPRSQQLQEFLEDPELVRTTGEGAA